MFGDRKKVSAGPIGTLIGADAIVEGSLRFKGGLRIDGTIRGSVTADEATPSMLVLSENARIEGEVRASHLVINGTIEGPVTADELVELQPKARIIGEVRYRAVEMHHGAVIEGWLRPLEEGRPGLKLAANNE